MDMIPVIEPRARVRRRKPHVGYKGYIRIVRCPVDPEIGVPMYENGNHFDRATFATTLISGYYPCGMIVRTFWLGAWIECMVYKDKDGEPYLHECDKDGFLVEDGEEIRISGTASSARFVIPKCEERVG